MKCRHDKNGHAIFEMDPEHIDLYMDVVNPKYVGDKR